MDFRPVEQNLRGMFRGLAAFRASSEIHELRGVTIASLGAAFQMFNAGFLNEPVTDESDFQSRISMLSGFMQARALPWAFWLCEDWVAPELRKKTERVLHRNGLRFAAEHPGMMAESIRPPLRQIPMLDVQRVSSERARRAFCQIGAACFHVPLDWFEEIFDFRMADRDAFQAYLGYLHGEPVATAATVSGGGVTGIYNVATLPDYRGRGLGEAITRHALACAKENSGAELAILQATRFGLGIYERMGFSTVTRFQVFTS